MYVQPLNVFVQLMFVQMPDAYHSLSLTSQPMAYKHLCLYSYNCLVVYMSPRLYLCAVPQKELVVVNWDLGLYGIQGQAVATVFLRGIRAAQSYPLRNQRGQLQPFSISSTGLVVRTMPTYPRIVRPFLSGSTCPQLCPPVVSFYAAGSLAPSVSLLTPPTRIVVWLFTISRQLLKISPTRLDDFVEFQGLGRSLREWFSSRPEWHAFGDFSECQLVRGVIHKYRH